MIQDPALAANMHQVALWDGEFGKRSFSLAAHLLVSADYNQIGLRILAHLCRELDLLDALARRVDLHSATASQYLKCHPPR